MGKNAIPTIRTYVGASKKTKLEPYFKRRKSSIAARDGHTPIPWKLPALYAAYNWPSSLRGKGLIAIIELDGGWVQTDMNAFFSFIGQPAPLIIDVSVDGTQNNPNQYNNQSGDPDIEVALDIQVAASAYYAATGIPAVIHVYWASASDPGGIAKAVRAAMADGCDVCSISWGSDEANWQMWGQQSGQNFIQDMEAAATSATEAGMIVFASSGDNDSSDGGQNPANVDLPSSCPHVIGCGGTMKTTISETVWNNTPGNTSGEGTGGGYSTVFPLQSWQAGAPNGPGRMVPDVAADADPNSGYWIVVHGEKIAVGGTSAVAPLFAGLFAAFGEKLGFITPTLWANQLCFNDITHGDNGAYRAVPGPDPCTGLGSPIGIKLATLFSALPNVSSTCSTAHDLNKWSGKITSTNTYENGKHINTSITHVSDPTIA